MADLICYSPAKEGFNYRGESIGIGSDRALFYHKHIPGRYYRRSLPCINDSLCLCTFKSIEKAQELCDTINQNHNDDFKPLEI